VYSLEQVGPTSCLLFTTRSSSVPECSPAWQNTPVCVPRTSNPPPNSTLHPTAGAGVAVLNGKGASPAAGERGR